ncbi:hypothetical protein [Rubrivivax gelatinosus]|uniref:Capsule polysaccharide biosynthesis protein n=1 Tax=Rubrivivax gelatinosus TaxID=28068 RepID=A0A4V2SGK1_RUBGE|nr:hypothetical protein [Rubrivivax gelatinosus]MBK1690093.1 hypothetical protein [Rubrivivax gelatinosus]TCP01568.1 hypothetical protein EV684_109207 [Rubrivivax gelatinosus]
MSGLHLVSCYLRGDAFVDGFLRELEADLQALDQRLIVLPTYSPVQGADALPFIETSYTLDGYRRMAPGDGDAGTGLLPEALSDAEQAWTHHPRSPRQHRASVAAAQRFFGRLLDELEPDTVSVWNPTVPQGRLLQLASLARAIPCYGIERGVFAETMMLESREVGAQADVALCTALRSMLAACPEDGAAFDAVREHYAQRDFARYAAASRCAGAELRAQLGIPAQAPVVVLALSASAANWLPRTLPGARFASPWFDSAEAAANALLQALPPEAFLVVQNHPLDRGHCRLPRHPRMRHVERVHIKTLFDLADLLCFMGSTTVQHEALLEGKPVLLLSRSQLSGQGVAYEYHGGELAPLLAGALRREGHEAHRAAAARYVPALFRHVLYGRGDSPACQRPADLARHLAGLESFHPAGVEIRIQRWLGAAGQDLKAAEAASKRMGAYA